ncbi:helicase-exonuclease AddAB subunit AddB [Calidifontibacillus erzurumensis]|uniref:ATP-dependent helicase/deoxyribonuclease subunit B n=1 Tax=Calidifontibacillus erzurumensis TaxID=2741433 RepID=A0A8J8GFP8_9BACI|nr:helicase-exonuclease AddAB subunit AddB [Calidifontibacillus erzurumensis]NSL53044.1 helicase-exonuclease AddAB subunit AddB [Calidifontibacillus erzurumensis]
MSLRLIVGRSGSGKSHFILDEIKKKLINDPAGPPIIFLVPDQMTFQIEYQLINMPEVNGMIRAQVFSFTRLAWRVLQETEGFSRYHLNSVGLHMLLRKIIEHRKEELKVFTKVADQTGFISQMEKMIAEFKRYCLSPSFLQEKQIELSRSGEDFSENIQTQAASKILADKLYDFYLIYQDYENHLLRHYVDSEDYLRLLAENICKSEELKNADIYVDGFHSFTPQELEVLTQLFKHCNSTMIALTVDPEEFNNFHDLHLFRMTLNTYFKIQGIANENGIKIEQPIVMNEPKRFLTSPALQHLEKNYDRRPGLKFDGEQLGVKVIAAVNRRAEVEQTAREILHLVQTKNYRWRDFAILLRDSRTYHDLLQTIFEDYQIPVFLDEKRSMLNHPLIEFIRSSLDVIHGGWRYEAIFRCIKTDLMFPFGSNIEQFREEMDQFENYVLAYGIQGKRWTENKRWEYRRIRGLESERSGKTDKEIEYEEKINKWRSLITDPLLSFEKNLKKAKTARDYCEALFYFLEGLDVPKKIDQLSIEAENQGNLLESRDHSQVWQAVMDLLDQMVELVGEEKLSFELFRKMILSGIESMHFATVPPALDQVVVGNMEHSRLSNTKCTFILGANDGVIPMKPTEEGVLTEEERESLAGTNFLLAPGTKEQLLDEQFLIYLALTNSSDLLYISYPMADDEGKSLMPSIIFNRLKDLFPNLQETLILNEPSEEKTEDQLKYIVNPKKTMSYLSLQLQNCKRGYPVHHLWWDVYNWMVENEEWEVYGKRILSSLFYKNQPKFLSADISRKLYGEEIKASVSRMELFQACPYSQFLSYGLRLEERQIFRLEAPDIGQLFHAALKLITEMIQRNHLHWANLTKAQCEQFAYEAVEKLAPNLQKEILLSSNRYHYIKRKLQQVVGRASIILSEHAKISGFEPIGHELAFGSKGPLSPLRFQLKNGCTMEVVGRIDRVDKSEGENGVYLRIIDYKSSKKGLNLSEVYFGLALQMLTYLDVVITNSKKWLGLEATPAGVLYFHVHNPMLHKTMVPTIEEIENEIFKQFKMKGLLVADHEAIRLMDQTLESGYSDVIPVALKKDGSFYSNSSVASKEDFNHLRSYVRGKIQDIGTAITNGVIDIEPYKLNDQTPCTYCSYKAICQFDRTLEENKFNIIVPEKSDVILEKIRQKGGEMVE